MTDGLIGAEVDAAWERSWSGLDPTGDRLRVGAPDRWVRVHLDTLPADADAVLGRHRALLGELFDEDAELAVLAEDWPAVDGASGWTDRMLPDAVPWRTLTPRAGDGAATVGVSILPRTDVAALLEPVVAGRALLVIGDMALSRLYAPYDLGADLFFVDDDDRAAFRDAHRALLSTRPDGL